MKDQVFQALARMIQARENCRADENKQDWFDRHSDHIDAIMKTAPSGSGIDNGTKIDLDRSNPEKIVLYTGFHHMNDAGFYDGWTEHTITITPSLVNSYNCRISGRNRKDIKSYLEDVFTSWLSDTLIDTYDKETDRFTCNTASMKAAQNGYQKAVKEGKIQ